MMTADLTGSAGVLSERCGDQSLRSAWNCQRLSPPKALTAEQVTSNAIELVTYFLTYDLLNCLASGHVPGSINIGLGGQFAMWAGSLIPMNADLVIVAETSAQVDEAVRTTRACWYRKC